MLSDLEVGFCRKQYSDSAAGRWKPIASRLEREFNIGLSFLLFEFFERNTYPFRLSVRLGIYPSVSTNSVTSKLRLSNARRENNSERSVIFNNRRLLRFTFWFFFFTVCV